MLQDKYKYSIVKNGDNNKDYYINVLFCSNSKNIGYLQYVSEEQNISTLIKSEGGLTDIILENPNFVIPIENNDIYFDLVANSIISGITDSNQITTIRAYDKNNQYPLGSRVIDGKTINILDYNQNMVHYKIDLIDYITYFNKNIYNETVLVSGLTTISETKADFIIPIEDKYKITVNYNTLKNYSSTTNNLIVFNNGVISTTYTLPINLNKPYIIETSFNQDDKITMYYSSSTNSVISSSVTYTIETLYIDNEEKYVTYYFFGNKNLNKTNTQNGFLYKSDKQHYHEKPIINNNIKVERNNISVFKPLFDLGTVNFINDIKF